jgi:hypothetical protein
VDVERRAKNENYRFGNASLNCKSQLAQSIIINAELEKRLKLPPSLSGACVWRDLGSVQSTALPLGSVVLANCFGDASRRGVDFRA